MFVYCSDQLPQEILLWQPQLAAAIAARVRIVPQFERFYTDPVLNAKCWFFKCQTLEFKCQAPAFFSIQFHEIVLAFKTPKISICDRAFHKSRFLGGFQILDMNFFWGQSHKSFYTLGRCEKRCLNWRFNEKEKCNPINLLNSTVLTLWQTKVCRMALFTCFRMRL